jgi:putative transposase
MGLTSQLSTEVGVSAACQSLHVARATFYRRQQSPPAVTVVKPQRRRCPRALTEAERTETLSVLRSAEFVDRAPAAVHATLLDQGRYLCSPRTMYRLLAAQGEVRERRNQLIHPHYERPELLATAPNQLWSWDITKLKSVVKWTYFYLYVVLDIFSRYVVGWMVATRETAALARQLLLESCLKQSIRMDQLTIHSDRGPAMTSKPVALLLADLGVTRSLSRPHVSNDNPFSESQFKTLKYCPEFPERFGSLQHARSFSDVFFTWHNQEHRHSGIAMLTPEMVHYGRAEAVIAARRLVLEEAYRKHPERFVRQPPEPLRLPAAVWINPPAQIAENSSCGPSAEKTSRIFDPQAIFSSAPDTLDGPESHRSGEIQSVATLNSIVQLSQNC